MKSKEVVYNKKEFSFNYIIKTIMTKNIFLKFYQIHNSREEE